MKDVTSISKKLWQLIIRLLALVLQLCKQVILPNRKRKGNLLNVLFLFYIGIIETIQQLEHRNLRMTDLFQNRWVRKGLMLFTCLLFFLTSYEQPVTSQPSLREPATIECSCQRTERQLSHIYCIQHSIVSVRFSLAGDFLTCYTDYFNPLITGSKRYLQNRRLLI